MKVLRHSGEWSEQTELSLTEGTKQNKQSLKEAIWRVNES